MARRGETFREVLEKAQSQRGVALMGICNVTPDSFSDGGRHYAASDARARVDALLDDGADFIDIGGESTRPGAPRVSAKDQIARVLEVVRYAASRGACVSIDTTSPEVANACFDAGACLVNDVSCLRDDELAKSAASHGAAFALMHARGTQEEMRGFGVYPDDAYRDVVKDVLVEWSGAAERAVQVGVRREWLVMDPGLGFAKNAKQSAKLLRRVRELVDALDEGVAGVMIGASRKSFLTLADANAKPTERLGASIAAAVFAARAGAAILRVHDVAATRQAIDVDRLLASEPT